MGFFRELPNIAYQSPLSHKNSSRDYIVIKNKIIKLNKHLLDYDLLKLQILYLYYIHVNIL